MASPRVPEPLVLERKVELFSEMESVMSRDLIQFHSNQGLEPVRQTRQGPGLHLDERE